MPEARNGGFRVGAPIVRDTIMKEVQDCKLKEVYSQSIFSKAKRSPRGVKRGGINLQYGPNGGFRNVLKPREKSPDLNELLRKQNAREKYHYLAVEKLDKAIESERLKHAPQIPNPDVFNMSFTH